MNANETVVVASRPRPIHFIAHTRNLRTVSVTVRWHISPTLATWSRISRPRLEDAITPLADERSPHRRHQPLETLDAVECRPEVDPIAGHDGLGLARLVGGACRDSTLPFHGPGLRHWPVDAHRKGLGHRHTEGEPSPGGHRALEGFGPQWLPRSGTRACQALGTHLRREPAGPPGDAHPVQQRIRSVEDGHAAEERLLQWFQPGVAPPHSRPQRLVPGRQVPGRPLQQGQPVVQAVADRLRGSAFTCAAASSSARGRPSRPRQNSATACALAGVTANARSTQGQQAHTITQQRCPGSRQFFLSVDERGGGGRQTHWHSLIRCGTTRQACATSSLRRSPRRDAARHARADTTDFHPGIPTPPQATPTALGAEARAFTHTGTAGPPAVPEDYHIRYDSSATVTGTGLRMMSMTGEVFCT